MREKRVPLELNFFKVLVSNQTSGVKKKKILEKGILQEKSEKKSENFIKSIEFGNSKLRVSPSFLSMNLTLNVLRTFHNRKLDLKFY